MNDPQWNAVDDIPVLSDVVIPGSLRAATDLQPVPALIVQDHPFTEHLKAQADILLAEMQQRIERMIEEELALAHSSALETARLALQQRLSAEMESRLNAFIEAALQPRDA